MKVKIKKLSSDVRTPTYATDGSACFDIYALTGVEVNPRDKAVVDTGLSFEIPKGHVMLMFSRSGHGFKHGIRLCTGVSVIDSDYRGEVKVGLTNDNWEKYTVHQGERIAQAMILPVSKVVFAEVLDLSETDRGSGGFGSTGKR